MHNFYVKEAYPFSGNGTLTASSASCLGVAVALVQLEYRKALCVRGG